MIMINGVKTDAKEFAYDGCHKIYLIEDEEDKINASEIGYSIFPIEELENAWDNSCELRFIHNWKLDKDFVKQFEGAVFTEV